MTATYSTVICLNRTELKTTAVKYVGIGIIHLLVRNIHAVNILIKGIHILHDKLTATHQAKARTDFITVLILNLVQHQWQLLIGTNLVTNKSCNHFLMGRSKTEATAMTIIYTPHLITVNTPAARLLPNLCWLYDRHRNFLTTSLIHFITDNSLDLFDSTPSQWHIGIKTACRLADHTCTEHELMTFYFCLCWNLTESWSI